ncbi:MAG: tetratricopeptide repeat protein [Verrucomicrobiota bacterium]|nr:tetratricopeptide repeat protein [Verrucomicrobiota bacterium]
MSYFPYVARAIVIAIAAAGLSCQKHSQTAPRAEVAKPASALEIVLTPLGGTSKEDREIAELQQKIEDRPEAPQLIEQLGWAFVGKARLTSDPGFYKLAEQCSTAMEVAAPGGADAALLRGHILHALHRFKEAEAVARDLTSRREFVFDYALLGDALMEQGQLGPAVEAYQKMVDLKPCLQTYSRVAHIRWLKGDLAGAVEIARVAVRSGSPREAEPLAWACTRLAAYLLQQGDLAGARSATDEAIQIVPDYSAALLMRGKLLLADGDSKEAAAVLAQAAAQCPLPEYLWTQAEALRAAGDLEHAQTVEAQLRKTGAANDPRTYSLFLATAGGDPSGAVQLAKAELDARQDVFTHDAMAWALFRSGDIAAAKTQRDLALSEGTQDARLLFHAGMIAAAGGEVEQGINWLTKAEQSKGALLPSERAELTRELATIAPSVNRISAN